MNTSKFIVSEVKLVLPATTTLLSRACLAVKAGHDWLRDLLDLLHLLLELFRVGIRGIVEPIQRFVYRGR